VLPCAATAQYFGVAPRTAARRGGARRDADFKKTREEAARALESARGSAGRGSGTRRCRSAPCGRAAPMQAVSRKSMPCLSQPALSGWRGVADRTR